LYPLDIYIYFVLCALESGISVSRVFFPQVIKLFCLQVETLCVVLASLSEKWQNLLFIILF